MGYYSPRTHHLNWPYNLQTMSQLFTKFAAKVFEVGGRVFTKAFGQAFQQVRERVCAT
jgi:hypothetical protein